MTGPRLAGPRLAAFVWRTYERLSRRLRPLFYRALPFWPKRPDKPAPKTPYLDPDSLTLSACRHLPFSELLLYTRVDETSDSPLVLPPDLPDDIKRGLTAGAAHQRNRQREFMLDATYLNPVVQGKVSVAAMSAELKHTNATDWSIRVDVIPRQLVEEPK